jgi:hypothetical protein
MNNETFTNQTNQGLEIRHNEDEPTRIYPVLPNSVGVPVTNYQPNRDLIYPTNQGTNPGFKPYNSRVAPAYTGIIVGGKKSKKWSTSAKVAIAICVIISALIVIAAIVLIVVFASANPRRETCSEGYSILDCSLGN